MVRRKIEIKRIENDSKRYTTFSKRRDGLFKKTNEYCTMSGSVGTVIAVTKFGNVFVKAHPHIDVVLDMYAKNRASMAVTQQESKDEDDDDDENSVRLKEETVKNVGEAMMKKKAIGSALMNVEFSELDGLEKVFKSMLEDTKALKQEAKANILAMQLN